MAPHSDDRRHSRSGHRRHSCIGPIPRRLRTVGATWRRCRRRYKPAAVSCGDEPVTVTSGIHPSSAAPIVVNARCEGHEARHSTRAGAGSLAPLQASHHDAPRTVPTGSRLGKTRIKGHKKQERRRIEDVSSKKKKWQRSSRTDTLPATSAPSPTISPVLFCQQYPPSNFGTHSSCLAPRPVWGSSTGKKVAYHNRLSLLSDLFQMDETHG